jgi:hypothetical protein
MLLSSVTQALVNVLVVPPEGLMGLVNGSLRLDHREALKFIRLREDYMTAAVEGRTLQVGCVWHVHL